jgi:hypothetical protein
MKYIEVTLYDRDANDTEDKYSITFKKYVRSTQEIKPITLPSHSETIPRLAAIKPKSITAGIKGIINIFAIGEMTDTKPK